MHKAGREKGLHNSRLYQWSREGREPVVPSEGRPPRSTFLCRPCESNIVWLGWRSTVSGLVQLKAPPTVACSYLPRTPSHFALSHSGYPPILRR